MITLALVLVFIFAVVGTIIEFDWSDLGEVFLALSCTFIVGFFCFGVTYAIIDSNMAYRETKLQERAMIIKNIEVTCSGIDNPLMLNSKSISVGKECSEWIEEAKRFNNNILTLRKYNPIVYRLILNIFPIDENPINEARNIPLIEFGGK